MDTYTIRGIAMDMDGVIIDSNTEIERFWRGWAAKENIAFTDDTMVKYILGRTGADTLNELFTNSSGETKQDIREAAIVFDTSMQPPLVPGVADFVKAVAEILQNITLVTSSKKPRAKKMLVQNGIEHYFKHYVTGDEVQNGKPHPEAFLKAAEQMKKYTYECLAFEDSNSGILSAAAAGMYVIAVNNYQTEHEKIIGRINDFTELNLLQNIIYSANGEMEILLKR